VVIPRREEAPPFIRASLPPQQVEAEARVAAIRRRLQGRRISEQERGQE